MIFKNNQDRNENKNLENVAMADRSKTEMKRDDVEKEGKSEKQADAEYARSADGVENEKHSDAKSEAVSDEKKDVKKEESEEEKLSKEVADQKDKYLRLAAEFDNYRRRTAKERLDLIDTASEGVIVSLLPIVDDFERAIDVLSKTKDAESAKQGTELIYKKMIEFLKKRGVTEIEAVGKELDTDMHEAVAQMPAKDPKQKGKIVEIAQKGYKLNGKVIRFAKVVIGI